MHSQHHKRLRGQWDQAQSTAAFSDHSSRRKPDLVGSREIYRSGTGVLNEKHLVPQVPEAPHSRLILQESSTFHLSSKLQSPPTPALSHQSGSQHSSASPQRLTWEGPRSGTKAAQGHDHSGQSQGVNCTCLGCKSICFLKAKGHTVATQASGPGQKSMK